MRYFVGIIPEPGAKAQIEALRRRYPGRLQKHVEPHITILPPAEYSQSRTLSAGLSAALSEVGAFEVRLGNPGYFGNRVLFLSVEGDVELLELREAIVEKVNLDRVRESLPAIEDKRGFHPHLTLAMASFGTPFPAMAAMNKEAAEMIAQFRPFRVEKVRAFVRGASGWETWRDFPLARK